MAETLSTFPINYRVSLPEHLLGTFFAHKFFATASGTQTIKLQETKLGLRLKTNFIRVPRDHIVIASMT